MTPLLPWPPHPASIATVARAPNAQRRKSIISPPLFFPEPPRFGGVGCPPVCQATDANSGASLKRHARWSADEAQIVIAEKEFLEKEREMLDEIRSRANGDFSL
jgi:hypothetical protein